MREGFARADGLNIHYVDHGGAGPALLLVHATGFHARVWDPLVAKLGGRFRVVALDQRGHGDSDKPESGYEWESFGHDVLAVVDELGLERPLAAGHSAGGASLLLAEGARPGTFGKVVLMDPVTPATGARSFMTAAENPLAEGARRRRRVWDSEEQMQERLRERSPLATWREEFRRAYVVHGTRPLPDGTIELKCPPEVEAQVYEGSNRHRGWDLIGEVAVPLLLLVGEHSPMWAEPVRGSAAARIRTGRTEVVPGGGHFFPMELPDETSERLIAFLGS